MTSTDLTVEIAGVWLPNKGAELMAHATVAALGARLPGARFVCRDQGPRAVRRAMGMEPLPKLKPRFRKLKRFAPEWYDDRHLRREHAGVSHVIDISGFAYGDDWGYDKARTRAGRYLRAGFPVSLMPQAFGPFEDAALRDEMRFVLGRAAHVAARDRVSLGHLEALGTGREIPLIPDITIGLAPQRPAGLPEGPFGCLVLNAKVLGTGAIPESEVLDLFGRAARMMRAHGRTPLIVLHEPVADRPLSEKLAAAERIEVVEIDDARALKGFVAGSDCVVTARFHGLANGLSSGVPSFAVSWSHKYGELLEDFGQADCLYDGDPEAFAQRIGALLGDAEAIAARRQDLRRRAAEKKAQVEAFWDGIAEDMLRRR